jgi:fimbrial chaperone protein
MKSLFGLLAAVIMASAPLSMRASTAINNVVMEVDSRGRTTTEITNIGTTPIGYVLTSYEWLIDAGEDVYTETRQFLAVPPSFQLAPGETMTVRVGFRNPAPSRIERTFRLSVREVPTVTAEEGLSFAYNHMLPVYIAPAGGRAPVTVSWSLVQRDGAWFVRVQNEGNSRTVMRRLVVGGSEIATSSKATVLAQSWREYPVPASAVSAGSAELDYEFTNGAQDTITVTTR